MKSIHLLLVPIFFVVLAFIPDKTFTVTGTISDELGKPIAHASIQVKGLSNNVSSGSDGWYRITVPKMNVILVVSAPGYNKQEIRVKGREDIDVVMTKTFTGGTFSGVVLDENGAPIQGASIRIKGTRVGVAADNNGEYKISAKPGDVILVTGVGIEPIELKVGSESNVVVNAKRSVTTGTEVVVTAYGVQRKSKEVGYANTTIRADQISSAPVTIVSQTISGKAAGLTVYNTSSTPIATDSRIVLRGSATIRKDTDDGFEREGYDKIIENEFLKSTDNPLSTFSIDVDAASYSNIRRYIKSGILPPNGAIRIEEMINYFKYNYPQPENKDPFSITTELGDAPWNKDHKLVLIGLQGRFTSTDNLPPSNLTFLIDVSGSMYDADKLPLVKESLKLLVDQLRAQDRISMVVYAGAAGLVLSPTAGNDKTKIKDAIDRLEAGGSTAGGAGLRLAYKTAKENFMQKANNRVILCTDGDFNVGESSDDAMERLIEEERKSGVFLTVLGFGTGNYQDAKMQKLADKGNGNHAYIDGIEEAKKVLVREFGGTLFTIAKDVKLQVEFNPAKVQGYRLIGYENRMLAKEDFNNDLKDAGDMGSGHTVTALYEIIPVGVKSNFLMKVDSLKYQSNTEAFSKTNYSDELMTVKFRYKKPDEDKSALIEHPVKYDAESRVSENFSFAAAVAEFGMLLRNSDYKQSATFESVLTLAKSAKGKDEEGYRTEFISLVENAQKISKTSAAIKKPTEKTRSE